MTPGTIVRSASTIRGIHFWVLLLFSFKSSVIAQPDSSPKKMRYWIRIDFFARLIISSALRTVAWESQWEFWV